MPLSPTALEPLLRLALVPGVGPNRLSALIRRFGSAERALAARASELKSVGGIGDGLIGRLRTATESAAGERARAALAAMQRVGAVAITPDDLAYPDAFHTVPDSPYLVFACGDLDLLESPGIAIVGTRRPTTDGREIAAELSGALARRGYTVVSGMAKGIDAAAHSAALDANARTIGVLGHGIDRVYPAENRRLFGRMRDEGLLLSEFAPGEKPLAGNFPRRNRLIAALSRGVLVVEMGTKSGAQHTVTYALDQGKDVFAVPGPIGSPASAGTNQLLKDGARLVTSVEDIIEELEGVGQNIVPGSSNGGVRLRPVPDAPSPRREFAPPPADLNPDETRILSVLATDARHIDDLAAESGLATSRVLGVLLGLELRELVESLPGKRFRKS